MTHTHKKVLFIRFSSLGDVIIANFYAMKLKQLHPDWHLTWLVDSMYSEIVESQPWVDDVIVWDRKKDGNKGFIKIIKFVRSEGFNILIDMHNTDRSSFFSFFSNIPERYTNSRRIPFAHNKYSLDTIIGRGEKIYESFDYLKSPAVQGKLDEYFNDGETKKRLTLAIGASYEKKRWTVSKWIEFCKLAIKAGFILYLVGNGDDEIKMAEEIIDTVQSDRLIDLVGKLSLSELVQIVSRTDATISGDTGTLHIARALGKNIIGLFGPSALNPDYMKSLSKIIYCSCSDLGCENWSCTKPCLDTITAEAVLQSVIEIAGKGDIK